MIVTETMPDGRIRTYSDSGMAIRQLESGVLYADAVDIPNHYTYEETEIPLEDDEATAEDYEAALGEMGVGV